MKVIHSIPQLRRWVESMRRSGKTIGCVPTMGALHTGHLSLVQRARRLVGVKGVVVVSVFVNSTQFDRKSDLQKYPRRLASDVFLCRKAGVDMVFAPTIKAMYPADFSTWVEETSLSLPLCGARRPGHFRGVCTVVLKLFNLVQPDIAVFGQKDAQQSLVVRRMARDLNIPARIVVAPTIREPDGLAMSSRNECLSPLERYRAAALCQALELARKAFRKGERNAAALKKLARRHLLKIPGLRLEYLELRNISHLRSVSQASHGDLLAVAAFLGKTRLIDNVRL